MRRKTAMTEVMGILNVTPDSFSDGGQHMLLEHALRRAEAMVEAGASWIDVGGESTRPGAEEVSAEEELNRVVPVIELIRRHLNCNISVDTSKAAVMSAAVHNGAQMINDIRALREPGALQAAADSGGMVCLMHMQGQPRSMQEVPDYEDVVVEVKDFLLQRVEQCVEAGIQRNNLLLDPGFGFGKTVRHNYQLLHRLQAFHEFDLPLLIGLSRKSMLGAVTNRSVDERLASSVAGATIAALKGAQIIRVHDVAETVDAMKIVHATLNEE